MLNWVTNYKVYLIYNWNQKFKTLNFDYVIKFEINIIYELT